MLKSKAKLLQMCAMKNIRTKTRYLLKLIWSGCVPNFDVKMKPSNAIMANWAHVTRFADPASILQNA